MSLDAYSNMAEGDKADLHDLWVEQQERDIELDSLMRRLHVCYDKRHPDETPFEAVEDATKSYWQFRIGYLRNWIEKMEKEDNEIKPQP